MLYQEYLKDIKNFLNTCDNQEFLPKLLTAITIEQEINANEKFKLLSYVSLIIINLGSTHLLETYLNLLKKILLESDNTISSQEIYTLLSTRTVDGWTLGNHIAWKTSNSIHTYVSFIRALKEKEKLTLKHTHALQEIKSLIIHQESHRAHSKITHITSQTFITCLLNSLDVFPKKRTTSLFHLLINNLLPFTQYRNLLDYKDEICDYIIDLDDKDEAKKQKKLIILQHALNPQHPLGAFFAIARGKWKTDYHSGTFNKLTEAFLLLHQFEQPQILYQFLYTKNKNFTETFDLSYAVLLSQKTALCDYLCDDSNWQGKAEERISAINAALNPNTSLGNLIWCKRNKGKPTKTNGSRARLIAQLLNLAPGTDFSFIPDSLPKPENSQLQTIFHTTSENYKANIEKFKAQWDAIDFQNQSAVTNFITSLTHNIDTNGYTIWHKLANQPNNVLNKNFLNLILDILEKNPASIYEVFNLLNMRTSSGWTIGNMLACKQSTTTINLYLEVLLALKKYGLPSYLLRTLDRNQSIKKSSGEVQLATFTDCLAQNTAKNISSVITRFLFNDFLLISPTLLARKDDIRDFLLAFETQTEVKKQLALTAFNKIFTSGTKLNKYFLTQRGTFTPTYHSGTLNPLKKKFLSISGFTDPQKLYQALTTRNFPYYYEILAEQKEILFIYILSITNNKERKTAIKNALNIQHPLGKLFWLQRGKTKPSKDAGVLKELQEAYDKFGEWTHEETMQDILKHIQTTEHLYFILPNNLVENRNNLRNYILAHHDLSQKIKWLEDSLNPDTPLGSFFGVDILSRSKSPRLLYLFKALLYFASTPEAKKIRMTIYLAPPFDEIYRASIATTLSNSASFWKNPDQHNNIELSTIPVAAHTIFSVKETEEEQLSQNESAEEKLKEIEEIAEEEDSYERTLSLLQPD